MVTKKSSNLLFIVNMFCSRADFDFICSNLLLVPPHNPQVPQFQFATVCFVSSISLHYSNNVYV